MTPPISRPTSSDSKEQSPQSQSQEQPQAPKSSTPPKKERTIADVCPELAPKELTVRLAEIDAKIKARRAASAAWAAEQAAKQQPYITSKQRNATAKEKKAERKDDDVERLVSRARIASKDSPEARLHGAYRRHKELRLQRERESNKAVREAELKAQAEKEAEEARKKAEEEAEKAAKAAQEERDKLIRPLEPKWAEKVKDTMEIKSDRHVVATSPEGVELTRRDFGTLLAPPTRDTSHAWLNDEIVNAWFSTIASRKEEQDGYVKGPKNVPAYVAYNTAWYTTYKNKGVDGLAGWSRRKGIKGEKLLKAQKVFFPINTGSHWMLLIISPQAKTIEFLDSLHNLHPKERKIWMEIARKWIKMELGDGSYNEDEWTESLAKSSLQTNGNDCGAFTCFNALASAKNRDFGDVTAAKMQEARRIMGAILLNGGFRGDFEL